MNCHGKCKGHCSGQCDGRCQIDVQGGISCGSNVTCTGTCSGSYTSPRCESEFTPPSCTIDAACFEHCRTSTVANAQCDPTTVKVLANVSASGDVAKLVDSLNRNLPPLIDAAEHQGHIAVDIVADVVSSGQDVVNNAGSLDVHSAACAAAAAKSLAGTATDLNVSVQASVSARDSCVSNAQ
jgi:hypothetical protein